MLPIKTKIHPTGFPPVSKTLPQAIKRLAAALQPEKIILFGSYAYGNPTSDSDVDLLIIKDGDNKQTYKDASLTLYPREFPVDIIAKTPKEVEEAMKGGKDNSFFVREIINKGKILYDRHQRT
jgi:predicted nucleotidyltransferase